MSLEDAVRRSVEGIAGKLLLSLAVATIMGLSTWTLHSIADHSTQLSTVLTKIDDLAKADEAHSKVTDAAISKLADDDQKNTTAIAVAEAELNELRRTPHIAIPAQSSPQIPVIGDALSHIFPAITGHRPGHSRRGR